MKQESIYIDLNATDQLHLKRFYTSSTGEPVLMIHGSIENGKIFYSASGKGLAPYLAQQGYDVFVADLRGRGLSVPAISRKSSFGITETLREDYPAFIAKIKEIKGNVAQHWIGHSWGGVLNLVFLARKPLDVKVASMVLFGTKRRISIGGIHKLFYIDLMWNLVASIAIKVKGYLPAAHLGMGSDSETATTHRETNVWVKSKQWLDWHNGFDYAAALQQTQLPPTLYLTGIKDKVLGNPVDVQKLADETGKQIKEVRILSKANGNKHDYDHINILTHKDAPFDHFPEVVKWMKQYR